MQERQTPIRTDAGSGRIKSPFQRNIVFLHTGHIGDIIAFLPAFQLLNGTDLLISDCPWISPPMSGYKFDSLKPLLESQGIETSMVISKAVDYDMTNWRECYKDDLSLMDAQARFAGVIPRDGHLEITKPWLIVDENKDSNGMVVFNRSARYHNDKFPWKQVVNNFKKKALFVGTPAEHEDFCNRFGKVEYYKTESTLDVARLVQGCDLFVGNQSSSFWIAAALMKPLVQEVFPYAPNSIVKYPDAVYCFDESLTLK